MLTNWNIQNLSKSHKLYSRLSSLIIKHKESRKIIFLSKRKLSSFFIFLTLYISLARWLWSASWIQPRTYSPTLWLLIWADLDSCQIVFLLHLYTLLKGQISSFTLTRVILKLSQASSVSRSLLLNNNQEVQARMFILPFHSLISLFNTRFYIISTLFITAYFKISQLLG